MFDITSSKLLILGIVALIIIGPKDLPALLRTIGKYVGIIKRQAAEFRAQFDEAMRESERADLKRDVESLGREAEQSMRDAEHSVEKDLADAQKSVETALNTDADTATGAARPDLAEEAAATPLNGSGGAGETSTPEPVAAPAPAESVKAPETEKSGA